MNKKVTSCILATAILIVSATAAHAKKNQAALRLGRSGVSMLVNGRFQEAADSLQQAADVEPQNFLWWVNLGWALNALEKSDDAIKAFEKARELIDAQQYYKQGWVLWGLAKAYEDKKDCSKAAQYLSQWIAITEAQSDEVKNRKPVKDQLSVARQRMSRCPKKIEAGAR
jgi:tetratricopeptide (TPR) repeat protein